MKCEGKEEESRIFLRVCVWATERMKLPSNEMGKTPGHDNEFDSR